MAGAESPAALPSGSGSPRVAMFSLTVQGTPSSADSGWPARQRRSLAPAAASTAASAASGSKPHNAFNAGSQRLAWSTSARSTSRGETSPRRYSAASASASSACSAVTAQPASTAAMACALRPTLSALSPATHSRPERTR